MAEGIFASIESEEKTIHDLQDGEPTLDDDVILLGYWVDKGGPNQKMKEFMVKVKDKNVGVFCTLAFWADSAHGQESLHNGIAFVQEKTGAENTLPELVMNVPDVVRVIGPIAFLSIKI